MSEPNQKPRIALGLLAAAIAGCVGYFAFFWITRQGFYALILPPALLGLAAGYAVGARSQVFAIVCGFAGLALGIFTEWKFAPFKADGSLVYFVTHIQELKPLTQILLAVGTVISYRMALGMYQKPNE
jgi:hypothetical protein